MKPSLTTTILPADGAAANAAEECLAGGGLIAFPTETVYGLGADATNARAVARLYAAKGRPSFNPLIAHVCDLKAARDIARFDERSLRLAETFWPGPLSLVLPKAPAVRSPTLRPQGLDTIAVRVPAHPVAHDILRAFGRPVVRAVSQYFRDMFRPPQPRMSLAISTGRIDLIIDGGAVSVGVRSTIVRCFETPLLLRPGGLPARISSRYLVSRWPASAKKPRQLKPSH